MHDTLIGSSEIAKAFGVDTGTVRKWVRLSLLNPTLVTPGGHLRFDKAEFDRLKLAYFAAPAPVGVMADKPTETKIAFFLENFATTHSHLVWRPASKKTKQREIWRNDSPVFAAAEAERLAAQQKSDDDTVKMITGRSLKVLRDEIASTSVEVVAASLNVSTGSLRRFCEAFHIIRPLPRRSRSMRK